jgi:UDP-N-acetyl-D-galactosamine dehydrogenase
MGQYVAGQLVKAMLKKEIQVQGSKVLIMGLAFKENCPDIRNTKVVDVVRELTDYGVTVEVTDPWCDPEEAESVYGIKLVERKVNEYDSVIIAVAHQQYRDMQVKGIRALGKEKCVLYDLKYVLDKSDSDLRL